MRSRTRALVAREAAPAPLGLLVPVILVLAAAAALAADPPMVAETPRTSVRAFFFSGNAFAGEYVVNYSSPEWKAEYAERFDELTLGKRIRLGKDYWSTLDTFLALEIGGAKVKPGLYFLALERTKKGDWALVLLDDDDVRKSKHDAYVSGQIPGGILAELEHSTLDAPVDRLRIRILTDPQERRKQTLEIAFGPHRLTAPIVAKV